MSELYDTSSERDASFRSLPSFHHDAFTVLFRFGLDQSLVRIGIRKFTKIFGDSTR